jgi:hypothetical protein
MKDYERDLIDGLSPEQQKRLINIVNLITDKMNSIIRLSDGELRLKRFGEQ